MKLSEKLVNETVASAVKSSIDHDKLMKKACVMAVLWAAEHGRCEPLTKLFLESSKNDAEGVRLFLVNLTAEYGTEIQTDSGNTRKVGFLNWNKSEKAFEIVNKGASANEAKMCRAAINKAGYDDVHSKVPFGPKEEQRQRNIERDFDVYARAQAFITAGAKNGADLVFLEKMNAVLTEAAPDKRVNVRQIRADALLQAQNAIDKANKLRKKLGVGNDGAGEPAEVKQDAPVNQAA